MLAELELTLEGSVQYAVLAPEVEMKKLSIALAKKMRSAERDVVNVRGMAYHNGAQHAITLNIRTDQLIGVRLRSAEPKYGGKDAVKAGGTDG